jgi:type I restriction enzyme M protein
VRVLAPTKAQVLATVETTKALPDLAKDKLLLNASGQAFYNVSLAGVRQTYSENHVGDNLDAYVERFLEGCP